MNQFMENEWNEHISVANQLPGLFNHLMQAVQLAIDSLTHNGKILFCGNGGSAADAQHLATEMVVRYSKNRKALSAIAITTDTSALTAIGNDFTFKEIFSRQIEALGKPNDLVVAFTTSGKSPNILHGLDVAKSMRLKTVAFTGANGLLNMHTDVLISVPSVSTARIQEMHIFLGHMFCALIENHIASLA